MNVLRFAPRMDAVMLVQVRNPRSGLWLKVDTVKGTIAGYKKTPGPYKNIPKHRRRRHGAEAPIPRID